MAEGKRKPGRPPGSKNNTGNKNGSSGKSASASSAAKKSASGSSKAAGSKGGDSQKPVKTESRVRDEICSLIIMSLSVFLIIAMQTGTAGSFGEALSAFLKGSFGIIGYLLPYYLLLYGIMLFAKRTAHIGGRSIAFLIIIFLMAVLLNAVRYIEPESFKITLEELKLVYEAGSESGGLFGMFVGGAIVQAIGKPGLCIFSVVMSIISILLVVDTPISQFLDNAKAKRAEYQREREEAEMAAMEAEYEQIYEEEEEMIGKKNKDKEKDRERAESVAESAPAERKSFGIIPKNPPIERELIVAYGSHSDTSVSAQEASDADMNLDDMQAFADAQDDNACENEENYNRAGKHSSLYYDNGYVPGNMSESQKKIMDYMKDDSILMGLGSGNGVGSANGMVSEDGLASESIGAFSLGVGAMGANKEYGLDPLASGIEAGYGLDESVRKNWFDDEGEMLGMPVAERAEYAESGFAEADNSKLLADLNADFGADAAVFSDEAASFGNIDNSDLTGSYGKPDSSGLECGYGRAGSYGKIDNSDLIGSYGKPDSSDSSDLADDYDEPDSSDLAGDRSATVNMDFEGDPWTDIRLAERPQAAAAASEESWKDAADLEEMEGSEAASDTQEDQAGASASEITRVMENTGIRKAAESVDIPGKSTFAGASAVGAAAGSISGASAVSAASSMLKAAELNDKPLQKPYVMPPIELLSEKKSAERDITVENKLKAKAAKLEETLANFHVDAHVVQVTQGPAVTRYEVHPNVGVKVSSIVRLSDDIALNMEAKSIRIEAPIPGKAAVGIEIENDRIEMVSIREVIDSAAFRESKSKISFAVGRDIAGNAIVGDLKGMPHMLIAGATGSGKSVCINSIIISLLYKAKPDEVKLILVDPKVVELGNYNGIPHLLIPVVTEPQKAAAALNWAVAEMNDRYKKFAAEGARDLASYNDIMKEKGESESVMPQIVIIIDELADLMMAAPSQVEESICRLAQLARAAGMHLIVATQRPSVDVITGVIKANIPSRIAFAVSSQVDSRTILDGGGAEKLVGKGDMLYKPQGTNTPIRVQGNFVSDSEVHKVIEFVKAQAVESSYCSDAMENIERATSPDADDDVDELLPEAIETVVKSKQASVSMLQRRFRIGYNRAARIVDMMESRGVIGPPDGSRPRQVLWSEEDLSG